MLPVSGTVKIKRRGSNRYVDLKAGEQIPNGSSIDARKGRVTIVAAQSGTKLERADFFDGLFTVVPVAQADDAHADRAARLPARQGARGAEEAQVAQAVGRRQGQVPHQGPLRGGDRPRHAVAGQDTCTTTKVTVRQGSVSVRDDVRKRTVIVRKGKSYTARARR